ncbi:MAG: hypothetical protein ACLQMF_04035 [Rectinemataceae bacterium]
MAVVDFAESARRHWKDAETLSTEGRFANAGQLLGFSAECGLKALYRCLSLLPQATDGDIDWSSLGNPEKAKYKKHIDVLCQTAGILGSSPASSSYQSMIPSIGVFTTWSTDQRYWSDTEHTRTCATELPKWEQAAREVMSMLDAARKDGKLI